MHKSQGASLLDDDLAGGLSASVQGRLSFVTHRSIATNDGWIERDNKTRIAQQLLDALTRRQVGFGQALPMLQAQFNDLIQVILEWRQPFSQFFRYFDRNGDHLSTSTYDYTSVEVEGQMRMSLSGGIVSDEHLATSRNRVK
jgi:hypothetical protein